MCGLLKALGVRVRRIADLEEGALYIRSGRILLLDIELTEDEISQAVDHVLAQAWTLE